MKKEQEVNTTVINNSDIISVDKLIKGLQVYLVFLKD